MRQKREEESSGAKTHHKPTSKRVVIKTTKERVANTASIPVGCHGNMEGEEVTEFIHSRPYETVKIDNPVASGVQTVMFSKEKSTLSELQEYFDRNLAKEQIRDSGDRGSTIKTRNLQERDETCKAPDSR
jgi:hypothetical protein